MRLNTRVMKISLGLSPTEFFDLKNIIQTDNSFGMYDFLLKCYGFIRFSTVNENVISCVASFIKAVYSSYRTNSKFSM